MPFRLVTPSLEYLPFYADALRRGWSPDNVRGLAASAEHLARIEEDAAAFVASLDDPEAKAGPVRLPDGSNVARLPGLVRWIWDGDFCGSIGFRWRPGDSTLPDYVLGHIGFAVAPWKRGRGAATRALALMLDEARARGLDYVELTTDPDNVASQRVIAANGGRLVEQFRKGAAYGGGEALRYRIDL
jgi:predicted acetyltransferase